MPFKRRTTTLSPVKQAFMSHVRFSSNGCWEWGGMCFEKRGGYGSFTHRPSGIFNQRAHRVAYKLFVDPNLTQDEHILHKCDNPRCVNPEHLFVGDQYTNMQDKKNKGRQNKGSTHGMSKLAEADVLAIRADNRLQRLIAADYGVSIITVSDIQRRRSWAHI